MRIVTAGVYGFTEESFFRALHEADIGVFVDTRRRRAVRGSRYAFANSKRLQARLAEMEIRYEHRLDLAPSKEMVRAQDDDDREHRIRRSDREQLTTGFVEAYENEVLAGFDSGGFVESLGTSVESALIFCVERTPDACHRSLVAQRLADDLGVDVHHLLP